MITQETLKEVLHYDPESGLFTWLKRISIRLIIGNIAGSIDDGGYIRIVINSLYYRAHRLAWFYMTGKWPKGQVDHEDGIRHHNWWSNLREATNSQNQENQKKAKITNKSGLLGVSDSPNNDGRFIARIQTNGKQIRLGYFKTPEEAHRAYLKAKRELHEFGTL